MGKLTPSRIVLLGYIALILFGTFLLLLPISTLNGINFIDSLFTATSSVCVTGLIVKDTGKDFTLFGQLLILILIQLGGLGYMTVASGLFLLFRGRLTIRQTTITSETIESMKVKDLIKSAIKYTFIFESIGTIILWYRFYFYYKMSILSSFYYAIFHSISAFCNAGFSLFSTSFVSYRNDPIIIFTISFLFISGGLGFIVWREIMSKRITVHSKLVLTTTIILIILSFLFFFIFQFGRYGSKEELLISFFQSTTPRTAGFNVVNISEYKIGSSLFTIFLMFIGASPGGTGGGIKTITFALILLNIYSYLSGKKDVTCFNRCIDENILRRAWIIFGLGIFVITFFTFFLTFFEKQDIIKIMFEEVSAFGTVGLSYGSANTNCSLSSDFSIAGKIIIIITMLIGRAGLLTIGSALIPISRETFKLPRAEVFL